jgi:hypothetical protein
MRGTLSSGQDIYPVKLLVELLLGGVKNGVLPSAIFRKGHDQAARIPVRTIGLASRAIIEIGGRSYRVSGGPAFGPSRSPRLTLSSLRHHSERRKLRISCFCDVLSLVKLPITPLASEPQKNVAEPANWNPLDCWTNVSVSAVATQSPPSL